MKILHTADWHIGQFKGPVVDGVNLRSQDTVNCLNYMIKVAEEEKPDIVCVSGDVFHQEQIGPVRYSDEMIVATDTITKLAGVAKAVIVMRGTPNHDGGGQFRVLSKMFANTGNVHMETWAKDASHGYDQDYRWGEKGDYDCSSAVIQAWQNAGVPVKSGGATYTGDMKNVFLKNGFVDVTSKVNVATGSGLLRGDVLLNEAHHVAMYCGNGKEVEASINEKGTAHGGKPGDQTGKEFLIRSYRNYPWNCVLRYRGNISSASDTEKKQNVVAYVARFTKDCKCYSVAGKTQAKMFPVIKKNAVVDVMKYTETVNGKKWYFIRIPHPTEGFVREFVPAGYFKKLI